MRILEIRDDGGPDNDGYSDRYTIAYDEIDTYDHLTYSSLFLDDKAWGCHGGATLGEHLGELIEFKDLPFVCQQAVIGDVDEVYIDEIDTGWSNEEDEPELFYQQRVNEQLCVAIKASGKELVPMPDDDDDHWG